MEAKTAYETLLPSNSGNHGPPDLSIRIHFEHLRQIGYDPAQILHVIHQLRQTPWEEIYKVAQDCQRDFLSASSSVRSSQISTFSRKSVASSRSSFAPELNTIDDDVSAFSASPRSTESTSRNKEVAQHPNVPLFCFTCGNPFTSRSALIRHRKDHCECTIQQMCTKCPWSGRRSVRHYVNAHRDECLRCRVLHGERACDVCKIQLDNNTKPLTPKKAWGCPYCITSFFDGNEWIKHCVRHYERRESWSFTTMIQSLLMQPGLPWQSWLDHDWDKLDETMKRDLRDALQRFEVPEETQKHTDYAGWWGELALSRYVSTIRTSGQPYPSLAAYVDHHSASATSLSYTPTANLEAIASAPDLVSSPSSSLNKFLDFEAQGISNLSQQSLPFRQIDLAHHYSSQPTDSPPIQDSVSLPRGSISRPSTGTSIQAETRYARGARNPTSVTRPPGPTHFAPLVEGQTLNDFDEALNILETNLQEQRRKSPSSNSNNSFAKRAGPLPATTADPNFAYDHSFFLDEHELVEREPTPRQTRPMSGIETDLDWSKYTLQP